MTNENDGAAKAVIIDLGKQKAKKVKRLRKGRGGLMTDVNDAIAELKAQGVFGENAVPVVVVVERKSDVRMPDMKKIMGGKW